ncbi:ferritin-like domain-containing protein [Tumidithrix elongata RA019]|uniref:Ferritin-like domain-containing protein n=1 Tax=Tumidithrix elongata BACA0141 TaxID=2716417 RepID=A0AAW9PXR3_9CYAN|nr:ferritin-like domain-containing protein [Tumidithrix elongata RA019]
MKLFFNAIAQPTGITFLPYHHFLSNLLSRLSQTFCSILASAKYAVLIFLFSLAFAPTVSAYDQSTVQSDILTPQQVVEYALTLEKLEADFYRHAIAATQSGSLTGVPDVAKALLVSYGQDEMQHVTDLSSVLRSLGGNPDAIVIPVNPNYSAILNRNPFANPADLLLAGQYVEDLGVAAYKGQVQNLLMAGEPGKTVLAGALEIHSVEARHAAGIRFLRQTLLGKDVRPWIRDASEVIYNENRGDFPIPFSSEAFDGYATKEEVMALVNPILTTQPSSTVPSPSETPSGQPAPVQGLW